MPNITVAVDGATYDRVRTWCAQRRTSVSQVVRVFLNDMYRLRKVRRFPLPQAPNPQSLGEQFDELDADYLPQPPGRANRGASLLCRHCETVRELIRIAEGMDLSRDGLHDCTVSSIDPEM